MRISALAITRTSVADVAPQSLQVSGDSASDIPPAPDSRAGLVGRQTSISTDMARWALTARRSRPPPPPHTDKPSFLDRTQGTQAPGLHALVAKVVLLQV